MKCYYSTCCVLLIITLRIFKNSIAIGNSIYFVTGMSVRTLMGYGYVLGKDV